MKLAINYLHYYKDCLISGLEFKYVVLQPMPNPPSPDPEYQSFLERVPREILPGVRESLA